MLQTALLQGPFPSFRYWSNRFLRDHPDQLPQEAYNMIHYNMRDPHMVIL